MRKDTGESKNNKRRQTIQEGGDGQGAEASNATVGTRALAPAREVKITEDPKNYRRHSARNLELIGKSLADCGAGRSIVADAAGVAG